MEDLTLALITLTSFVLLFVVAIFADRAGMESEDASTASGAEPVRIALDDPLVSTATPASAPRIDDVA